MTNRIMQLLSKLRWRKKNLELLRYYEKRNELWQILNRKMVQTARQVLQERTKHPIEIIPDVGYGGTVLTKVFKLFQARLSMDDALKMATEAICKDEDALIKSTKGVCKIGIIEDLQLDLLTGNYCVIWEKLKPLTSEDSKRLLLSVPEVRVYP